MSPVFFRPSWEAVLVAFYDEPKSKRRRLKPVLQAQGARDPSRALIRARASGFTRTGPHCGPSPTRNSRSTAKDFSRSRNELPLHREWLAGAAFAVPAATARAAELFSDGAAGSLEACRRGISGFALEFERIGFERKGCACDFSWCAASGKVRCTERACALTLPTSLF